jgi:hypothetical protein
MGLLDDAIREHLELKRLKGADPGAVAREEQAALGPVRGEDEPHGGMQDDQSGTPSDSRAVSEDPERCRASEPSTVGQETVEINMDAELSEEAPEPAGGARGAATVSHPPKNEESLEWEMPDDRSSGAAGPDAEADHEGDEQLEDVLEETPDFLRDTPEQERLWFEQRPPRDFDFNE